MKESTSFDSEEKAILALHIIPATLSFIACSFLILFNLCSPLLRKLPQNRIIVCLLIADMINSIEAFFGFPRENATLCSIQGFLSQFASTSSVMWTAIISSLLYSTIVKRADRLSLYSKRRSIVYIVLGFITPLIYAILPVITRSYGPAGYWCWLVADQDKQGDDSYQFITGLLWRLSSYILVWFIIIYNICVYCRIHRILKKRRLKNNQQSSEKSPNPLQIIEQHPQKPSPTQKLSSFNIPTIAKSLDDQYPKLESNKQQGVIYQTQLDRTQSPNYENSKINNLPSSSRPQDAVVIEYADNDDNVTSSSGWIRLLRFLPIILVWCWGPLTINRTFQLLSRQQAPWLVGISIFFLGLAGILNALVYGCSSMVRFEMKRVFCKKKLFESSDQPRRRKSIEKKDFNVKKTTATTEQCKANGRSSNMSQNDDQQEDDKDSNIDSECEPQANIQVIEAGVNGKPSAIQVQINDPDMIFV